MSLSVTYSAKTEEKLQEVLWEMLAEALSAEPGDNASQKVADMVAEVVQLLALCKEYQNAGKYKRYDVHLYVSARGVEWQYFQVDR